MMKKRVYLKTSLIAASIATAGLALAVANTASAAITAGTCDTCHTMHNSQDGNTMALNEDGTAGGGPYGGLTISNCIGCHTAPTGATENTHITGAPYVAVTDDPFPAADFNFTTGLPGGYFNPGINAAADARMHNPSTLNPDTIFGDTGTNFTPPGYADLTIGLPLDGEGVEWTEQLTCAGGFGCHGTHSEAGTALTQAEAIKGMHHSDVGSGYRMLVGIDGTEDPDYTISGNRYAANETADQTSSISYLCSECHGDYHTAANTNELPDGTGSSWIRHPTDYKMVANTALQDGYETYNGSDPQVPVGTLNGADPVAGSNFVICLSCHFAHGGDQPDLLRWDYSDMTAGTGTNATGCFRCHTTKDDGL